jgi:hypothetical protein
MDLGNASPKALCAVLAARLRAVLPAKPSATFVESGLFE